MSDHMVTGWIRKKVSMMIDKNKIQGIIETIYDPRRDRNTIYSKKQRTVDMIIQSISSINDGSM